RPHHRDDPGPACTPAHSGEHARPRLPGHQGTLPRTAPSRLDGIRTRERSSLRQRQTSMTVQDTTPTPGPMVPVVRLQAKPAATKPPARGARRLPVQKDWPTWALIAAQIGILAGVIALWEIGARAGWIDAFFWSQPSAIFNTLVIFFTTGDAWTDIGFT